MLIVENDKDRRSLAWLQGQHPAAAIDAAVVAIELRGQKAYISMIAKQLKTRVPPEVWGMQAADLSLIRARLQQQRDEIAARVSRL